MDGTLHPAPVRTGAAVALRGVTRTFGANCVLRGIDLDIHPGEFVSVVGRSGCGKSTCSASSPASTPPMAAAWPSTAAPRLSLPPSRG